MQRTDIDVSKLDVFGGGEHWSRYYYTFDEFAFEFGGKADTYRRHFENVKTNEELAALIAETLKATEAYVQQESEKFISKDDNGAAHYMNSFGKWAPKYFIDVVKDANKKLAEEEKISGEDIGGSFLTTQRNQKIIDQMLGEDILARLGIKQDFGGRGRPK